MDGISRSQALGQKRVTYEARSRDCPGPLTPHCSLQASVLGCSDESLTARTGPVVCAGSPDSAVPSGRGTPAPQERLSQKIIQTSNSVRKVSLFWDTSTVPDTEPGVKMGETREKEHPVSSLKELINLCHTSHSLHVSFAVLWMQGPWLRVHYALALLEKQHIITEKWDLCSKSNKVKYFNYSEDNSFLLDKGL